MLNTAPADLVHRVLRRHHTVSLGEGWYESDHSIIAAHGRPAIAMTSTSFRELCATVTHTESDTLELVDPELVAAAAEFVADLVRSLPAARDLTHRTGGVCPEDYPREDAA